MYEFLYELLDELTIAFLHLNTKELDLKKLGNIELSRAIKKIEAEINEKAYAMRCHRCGLLFYSNKKTNICDSCKVLYDRKELYADSGCKEIKDE